MVSFAVSAPDIKFDIFYKGHLGNQMSFFVFTSKNHNTPYQGKIKLLCLVIPAAFSNSLNSIRGSCNQFDTFSLHAFNLIIGTTCVCLEQSLVTLILCGNRAEPNVGQGAYNV